MLGLAGAGFWFLSVSKACSVSAGRLSKGFVSAKSTSEDNSQLEELLTSKDSNEGSISRTITVSELGCIGLRVGVFVLGSEDPCDLFRNQDHFLFSGVFVSDIPVNLGTS